MKQDAHTNHTDKYKICRLSTIIRIPLVSNIKRLVMLHQSNFMLPADKKRQTTIKDRRSNSELEQRQRETERERERERQTDRQTLHTSSCMLRISDLSS
jgi:hypothetical protein